MTHPDGTEVFVARVDQRARRLLELATLTDDQLAQLAAYPMDAARWRLIEDELTRRIEAHVTAEWTLDSTADLDWTDAHGGPR